MFRCYLQKSLQENIFYTKSCSNFLPNLKADFVFESKLRPNYTEIQNSDFKFRFYGSRLTIWCIELHDTLRQESIRTADKNLTDFAVLSQIYWVLEKSVLISIEALICGYFEPKKLRDRPPNKAATPLLVKTIEFHSRGHFGFVWRSSP